MDRQGFLKPKRDKTPCLLVSACPWDEGDTVPSEGGEGHVRSEAPSPIFLGSSLRDHTCCIQIHLLCSGLFAAEINS